jgi:hypothetical protein
LLDRWSGGGACGRGLFIIASTGKQHKGGVKEQNSTQYRLFHAKPPFSGEFTISKVFVKS